MKAYTATSRGIAPGIALQRDEKLGLVLFLGEEGRGRHYEKVALDRRTPPTATQGGLHVVKDVSGELVTLMQADLRKVDLPPRDGKPTKSFSVFVAEREPSADALVRISSYGGYVRNGAGSISTLEGTPEKRVTAYGAFGDAGRVGSWSDCLLVLKPGDAVAVKPSRGESFVVWHEGGEVKFAYRQDYDLLRALEEPPCLVEAGVKCFTFQQYGLKPGLKTRQTERGLVVKLGEAGRGRSYAEIPAYAEQIETADVVLRGAQPCLEAATQVGDKFLVRVLTAGPYTRGTAGRVEAWLGEPKQLSAGQFASGAAGRVASAEDSLWLMTEGDALCVIIEGGYKNTGPFAVFVKGGELIQEAWRPWLVEDLRRDPAGYALRDLAVSEQVPASWVGRVVRICPWYKGSDGKYTCREVTAEVIRREGDTLIVNLGWDGRGYVEKAIQPGATVSLTSHKVDRLQGEALEEYKNAVAQAMANRAVLLELAKSPEYYLVDSSFQRQVHVHSTRADEEILQLSPHCPYTGLPNLLACQQHTLDNWAAEVKAGRERAKAQEFEALEQQRRQQERAEQQRQRAEQQRQRAEQQRQQEQAERRSEAARAEELSKPLTSSLGDLFGDVLRRRKNA